MLLAAHQHQQHWPTLGGILNNYYRSLYHTAQYVLFHFMRYFTDEELELRMLTLLLSDAFDTHRLATDHLHLFLLELTVD